VGTRVESVGSGGRGRFWVGSRKGVAVEPADCCLGKTRGLLTGVSVIGWGGSGGVGSANRG
jgi:hypothetical protein